MNNNDKFLIDLSLGRITDVSNELDKCTIEELEKLAEVEWDFFYTRGEPFFNLGKSFSKIAALHRKKKLNEQFVFNKKNIQAIVKVDQLFKSTCQLLKREVQKEYNNLMAREKQNPNYFYFQIKARITIHSYETKFMNTFLDWADYDHIDTLNNSPHPSSFQFTLSTNKEIWPENIDELPIFDFTTNFSNKLGDNKILAEHHIGYAFYSYYSESLLSLKDMLLINVLHLEITPHIEFLVPLQNNNFKTKQK
jgi:hypothetical protein